MKSIITVILIIAAAVGLVTCDVEGAAKVPRGVFIQPQKPSGNLFFWETFNDKQSNDKRWVHSAATKEGVATEIAQYDGQWVFGTPNHTGGFPEDTGLVLKESAKHYAIAAKVDKSFEFKDNVYNFVLQYEINFEEGLTCGGGYIKLLASSDKLNKFNDKTPYSIMFGPDRCGQTSKIHFIIQFKNPKTGEVEEKHCKQPTSGLDHVFTDKMTHLYTLVIGNNDKFSVAIDQQVIVSGSLQSDFTPSFVPPKEIDDPADKKPTDWDDKEKIPDPEAVKPDDWDEDAPQKIPDPAAVKPEGWLDKGPETIPDPDASQPEDWDEDEDGEWEAPTIANPICEEVGCGPWSAPLIANPAFKGKWRPPMITNPNYMGIWKPKRIDNPGYFELEGYLYTQLLPVEAVGFELWSMSSNIHFDNIIIHQDLAAASKFALEGWVKKREKERVDTGSDYLGPWMEYFIEIANDHPYLWALYALALVMPFVLCAACCVKKPKARTTTDDDAAKRKKTDAPTPDDPPRPLEEKSPENNETFIASSEEEEEKENKTDDSPVKTSKKEKVEEGEKEKQVVEDGEPSQEEESFQPRKSPRRGGGGKKKSQRED